jgi:hypothetical protein
LSINARTEQGLSGAWVVRDSHLLGFILAIYSDEPYVHMLPITAVFKSIRDLLSRDGRAPQLSLPLQTSTNTDHSSTSEGSKSPKVQHARELLLSSPRANREAAIPEAVHKSIRTSDDQRWSSELHEEIPLAEANQQDENGAEVLHLCTKAGLNRKQLIAFATVTFSSLCVDLVSIPPC